ncbi:uncharacterized protein FTJAE_6979 [Fusarium tjaetaba]|uniref:Uncharacterized protein n=1 Tax=Fusarium tjaetaba TaxID=1567544 RepID=A0A8H5VTG5_9HYPO|nr:uncharacterized protein FTJAE_6979 [Fusarium tjaetaba]KAF5633828.1 hypothetical protein FTJAE_6979 [Fusarium tjaetaba]
MSNPLIGLGQVFTAAPLSSDNIDTDPLLQSVKNGLAGGEGTSDYFNVINSMSQVYQQLKDNGRNAWVKGTDANGLPVYYVESTDTLTNKNFFAKISVDGLNFDVNNNVKTNGTTTVINGITYQGVGLMNYTSGWNTYNFSTTSWWLGVGISGAIAFNGIISALSNAIQAVANAQADAIQDIANDPAAEDGGEAEEEEEGEENASGDESISTEAGDDVAILEAEEGAVAWGDVFLGAGIVLAVLFVVLSFVLHDSFQYVRVWNLTRYKLVWVIQFDKHQNTDEGQLVIGPVHFNPDNSIAAYEPFLPLNSQPAPPGVIPPPSAQFADMNINSSSQYAGIGYVLQYQLQDPTSGEVAYTGTAYFDIPFDGDNSTNVTFDSVTDLQAWYDDNSGNNQSTVASTTTSDGKVTFFTTFDYLSGQHVVPQSSGGSPTTQYYYQSLVAFVENDLPSALQTAPESLPTQLFQVNPLKGIHPKIRRRVFGRRGKTAKAKKV